MKFTLIQCFFLCPSFEIDRLPVIARSMIHWGIRHNVAAQQEGQSMGRTKALLGPMESSPSFLHTDGAKSMIFF